MRKKNKLTIKIFGLSVIDVLQLFDEQHTTLPVEYPKVETLHGELEHPLAVELPLIYVW